jgi:hypothetical protein
MVEDSSQLTAGFFNIVMGRRQAVRHRTLVPAFGGSNPPAPAMTNNSEGIKINRISY